MDGDVNGKGLIRERQASCTCTTSFMSVSPPPVVGVAVERIAAHHFQYQYQQKAYGTYRPIAQYVHIVCARVCTQSQKPNNRIRHNKPISSDGTNCDERRETGRTVCVCEYIDTVTVPYMHKLTCFWRMLACVCGVGRCECNLI